MRPRPDPGVADWQRGVNPNELFLSVVTWAELRRGIVRLGRGARAERLRYWLEDGLARQFFRRILPVDLEIADAWGLLRAQRDAIGRPMGAMDCLIAATAQVHGLTLVTRNVRDFEGTVSRILCPWA
ncbi:MAG: type II toxin-antitoxin system VapC family toxin [Acetobacteraceae bacterium]